MKHCSLKPDVKSREKSETREKEELEVRRVKGSILEINTKMKAL